MPELATDGLADRSLFQSDNPDALHDWNQTDHRYLAD